MGIPDHCECHVLRKDEWGICRNKLKWKVVFTWATKYYCTYHKNRIVNGHNKKYLISVEKLED